MSNDEFDFALEKINELACLVCKNKDEQTVSALLICLEKRVDVDGYNHAVWYALARVNQSVSNHERAEQAYLKAINLAPLNTEYLERIARFYMSAFKWEKSRDYCKRLVALLPEKQRDVNGIMASVFYGCRMYQEAIQNVELGICFDDLQVVYKAMYSYIELNKEAEVITLADKIVLSENDASYGILELIAQSYFTLAMYDKALETFLKLADGDYKKYRNDVAATYSNMDDLEHSLPILREILSEMPDDVNALCNYALMMLKTNPEDNFDEAVRCYKKVLAVDGQNFTANKILALVYYDSNRFSDAYDYLLETYRLRPGDGELLRKAMICLLNSNDNKMEAQKGIDLFYRLKVGHRATANDYIMLGLFYRILGKTKEAIETSLYSLELEPTDAFYNYSVGRTFCFANEHEKAIRYFEKALLIDSNTLEYYKVYVDCLLTIGSKKKALEIARKALSVLENSQTLNQVALVHCELEEYDDAKLELLKAFDLELEDTVFKQELKGSLLYAYVMSRSAQAFLDLMETEHYRLAFNDDFSKAMKVVLNLKMGNYQAIAEILPTINGGGFPQQADVLYKAFSLFYLKKENWSQDCIDLLKNIDINDNQYVVYKEDVAKCLGLAYREQKKPDEALKYLKVACENGGRNAENWYNLAIEQLYLGKKADAAISIGKANECDNFDEVMPLKYFADKFEGSQVTIEIQMEFMLNFFEILSCVCRIKNILRYTDAMPVYHYTRVGVLKELIKDGARIRLNNAAHMNDPLEGTAIFNLLHDIKPVFDEVDSISPPNVFLTSFCSAGDELTLWVQYATDGTGCSLELDSDFFDKTDNDFYQNVYNLKLADNTLLKRFFLRTEKRIENQFKDIKDSISKIRIGDKGSIPEGIEASVNLIAQMADIPNASKVFNLFEKLFFENLAELPQDTYCLYRVAYINSANGVVSLSAEENVEINDILEKINNIFLASKQLLTDQDEAQIANSIFNEIIKDLLSEVQYLFKLDSYMHEKEVRVLKRVSIDNPIVKEFSVGDGLPTLYINLDKDIHFNRCVLGPKVYHPSKVAPVLYRNGKIDKVAVSEIEYR